MNTEHGEGQITSYDYDTGLVNKRSRIVNIWWLKALLKTSKYKDELKREITLTKEMLDHKEPYYQPADELTLLAETNRFILTAETPVIEKAKRGRKKRVLL